MRLFFSADGVTVVDGDQRRLITADNLVKLLTSVTEWRDAIRAIDKMSPEERNKDIDPLNRLIAAQNALLQYASEEMP